MAGAQKEQSTISGMNVGVQSVLCSSNCRSTKTARRLDAVIYSTSLPRYHNPQADRRIYCPALTCSLANDCKNGSAKSQSFDTFCSISLENLFQGADFCMLGIAGFRTGNELQECHGYVRTIGG
jgi:hypothetical protein